MGECGGLKGAKKGIEGDVGAQRRIIGNMGGTEGEYEGLKGIGGIEG